MKIGFDAKRAFLNKSGLGNYSRNILSYLFKYYPEHQYYLFSPKENKFSFHNFNKNIFTIYPTKKLHQNFSAYWRTFSIAKDIENLKIDIFHGLSNELPKTIKKTKAKSILTIHDLIFIRFPELYKPFDRKIYLNKVKYSCNYADKIIAISQQTKNDIVDFLKVDDKKIEVVYQGCNPIYHKKFDDDFKNIIRKKFKLPEKYLLNVGTIEPRKNILSVVKAIIEHNIDIKLVVIGKKTKYYNEIEKYLSKNNKQEQIIFLENVDIKEIATIYQMTEIFLYPSIFEGFGIPIIEAINSGVPVITSKGSCFAETGGKDSIYIEPYNIDEIADAINFLLKNSEKRQQIIDNGYKFVEKFKEENIANDIIKVYQSVL